MRQLEAMLATINLAKNRGYDPIDLLGSTFREDLDIAHFEDMYRRASEANPPYSEAKLGRHLGYIQGVLVAAHICTLNECKDINKLFASSDE